ncbi:MAG TPA: hypothetical protein DIU07_10605 [Rhodobacteraceae bacterium]|nr:hypothetical protein [Paracoccaceae bacterium]
MDRRVDARVKGARGELAALERHCLAAKERRADMAPGACRAIVSRPDGEDPVELRWGFSDWP